jgi:hypothetical protein
MKKLLSASVCVLAFFCLGVTTSYQKPTTTELMQRVPQGPVKHCKADQGLPDAVCTPGVVLTTSKADICNKVSTDTIRPSGEYTGALKVAQIKEYGFHDTDPGDYEEDHLVSLEIGGHPDDPKNLWPEPHSGIYGSLIKDKVENWLHREICSGAMTPEQAQKGIIEDWRQYIGPAGAKPKHKKVKEVE